MGRDLDARAASIAALTAALIIAQQIAGKAARDTLFLAHHAASELPGIMLTAAGGALVSVMWFSRLFARHGPARVLPPLFGLGALSFAGLALLHEVAPAWVGHALFFHVAALGSALVSGFWSVISERFDPHAARRFVARIAAGATAGGMLGGLLANRVAGRFGTAAVLPILAALSVFAALGVQRLAREIRPRAEPTLERPSARRSFVGSGYLRRIALVVTVFALAGAFLDYAFKATASLAHTSEPELAHFFSLYYTVIGLLTFAAQSTLVRPALKRLGVGTTLALMPLGLLAAGSAALAFPSLATLAFARGLNAIFESSTHRSAYELLFTPVERRAKRPTKLFIDVAAHRLGDALGGGAVILVLLVASPRASVSVALVLALGALVVALSSLAGVQRGYVAELAARLSSGAVRERFAGRLETFVSGLGLRLEAPIVQVAESALAGGDRHLQGTAREWLENVVPPSQHDTLWDHLEPGSERHEIVDEVLGSFESLRD